MVTTAGLPGVGAANADAHPHQGRRQGRTSRHVHRMPPLPCGQGVESGNEKRHTDGGRVASRLKLRAPPPPPRWGEWLACSLV